MDGTLSTIETIHPRTGRLNPYFTERCQCSQDRILNIHLFHHKPLKRADGDSHRHCGQQQGRDNTAQHRGNTCTTGLGQGPGQLIQSYFVEGHGFTQP